MKVAPARAFAKETPRKRNLVIEPETRRREGLIGYDKHCLSPDRFFAKKGPSKKLNPPFSKPRETKGLRA
jgi:hypothetical protein